MKLAFEPDLPHQRRAIDDVLAVFDGGEPTLANVQKVQRANALPVADAMPTALAVEMETGTGKTYTYLRTAFELARRWGKNRFVVVVPSIAVREGVAHAVETMRPHFESLFGIPFDSFVYASSERERLASFGRSRSMQIMIVNVQAFVRDMNLMLREDDRLGSRRPIDFLEGCIAIVDEPQKINAEAVERLRPGAILQYSATYDSPGKIHRLGPTEAFARGLVKKIEVACVPPDEVIREMVREHLAKESRLRPRGIKVLSLLFVDRVASYRGGPLGAQIDEALGEKGAHGGYFSVDRAGNAKDTSGETKEDDDTYDRIMRDKERLLSLEDPLRIVVSHSALREGWDNPNVFQVCTLNESRSIVRRRQEIGRGLRLCVDQNGHRVRDEDVNRLTVVASGTYAEFAATLQSEYAGEGIPFVRERNRRVARVREDVLLGEAFRQLWGRVSRKGRYRISIDTEALVANANANANGNGNGNAERVTGLTRATLARMRGVPLDVIMAARDAQILAGLRYEITGESWPLERLREERDVDDPVDAPANCLHDAVTVENASFGDAVFFEVPAWFVVDTPFGAYRPRVIGSFGVVGAPGLAASSAAKLFEALGIAFSTA